jgi:hypothetical protein
MGYVAIQNMAVPQDDRTRRHRHRATRCDGAKRRVPDKQQAGVPSLFGGKAVVTAAGQSINQVLPGESQSEG